jgi:hypothetical protein
MFDLGAKIEFFFEINGGGGGGEGGEGGVGELVPTACFSPLERAW